MVANLCGPCGVGVGQRVTWDSLGGYARRYALFTLVGIAGEDDLDAPDICMSAPVTGASTTGPSSDDLRFTPPTRGNGKIRGAAKTASRTVPLTGESAALRDRLLSEIAG